MAKIEIPPGLPELSELREIGWAFWDPIGLINVFPDWRGTNIEDEYDRYLIEGADMILHDLSHEELVAYFLDIAEVRMGLTPQKGRYDRVSRFVNELTLLVQATA